MAAFRAFLEGFFSALVDKYSEAAIESAAAIPVMAPVSATNFECCKAKAYPANAPVNSTKAAFRPQTTEPM